MNRMDLKSWALAWLWTVLAVAAGGCSHMNLASAWRDREIKVDGDDIEWASLAAAESNGISVRVLNDGDFLYLDLSAASHQAKCELLGVFKQGLTLMFTPPGGRKTGIHIIYTGPEQAPSAHSRGEVMNTWESMFMESAVRQVQLLAPGQAGYPRPLPVESHEILLEAGLHHSRLIYELAIPLHAEGQAFSLGAAPGASLDFEMELSAPSQAAVAAMRNQGSSANGESGGSGLGMGGGGGRHGGSRHGGGGGGGRSQPESLEPDSFHVTGVLKLAAQ